jgi:hypothetical protein
MFERIKSYVSFENDALVMTGLAFVFCGAVVLGFM